MAAVDMVAEAMAVLDMVAAAMAVADMAVWEVATLRKRRGQHRPPAWVAPKAASKIAFNKSFLAPRAVGPKKFSSSKTLESFRTRGPIHC